jgi:hypothetical protein
LWIWDDSDWGYRVLKVVHRLVMGIGVDQALEMFRILGFRLVISQYWSLIDTSH